LSVDVERAFLQRFEGGFFFFGEQSSSRQHKDNGRGRSIIERRLAAKLWGVVRNSSAGISLPEVGAEITKAGKWAPVLNCG